MANTYHQIYIHIIFAVKYRKATIDKKWQGNLQAVISKLFNDNNCKTLIVNGVEDHVHCFVSIKPIVSISELVKIVKSKSSRYINDRNLTNRKFSWQIGYGVFSHSHSQIDSVYKYIANQEVHHKKRSFKEEYLDFLEKFNVPFDERFIFEDLI